MGDHILIKILIWTAIKSMQIVMKISNSYTNYTQIPSNILNQNSLQYIVLFLHITPTIVLSVMFINTYLPPYFPFIEKELEKNSNTIPLLMLATYPCFLIIDGIIVEQFMLISFPEYKKYKTEKELF
jgi:hypothetical protein